MHVSSYGNSMSLWVCERQCKNRCEVATHGDTTFCSVTKKQSYRRQNHLAVGIAYGENVGKFCDMIRSCCVSIRSDVFSNILLADLQLDMRYDTIVEFTVDWKAECLQLSLAHMARKKYKKEENKTNKRQTNASVICSRLIFSAR